MNIEVNTAPLTCCGKGTWLSSSCFLVSARALQHHQIQQYYQSISRAHAEVLQDVTVCRPMLPHLQVAVGTSRTKT